MEKIFKKIEDYPEDGALVLIYEQDFMPDLFFATFYEQDKSYRYFVGDELCDLVPRRGVNCYYAYPIDLINYIQDNLI